VPFSNFLFRMAHATSTHAPVLHPKLTLMNTWKDIVNFSKGFDCDDPLRVKFCQAGSPGEPLADFSLGFRLSPWGLKSARCRQDPKSVRAPKSVCAPESICANSSARPGPLQNVHTAERGENCIPARILCQRFVIILPTLRPVWISRFH
jgi:hypothetical protein